MVCAGIPCQDTRDQASELLGCALAQALLDDAELGMPHSTNCSRTVRWEAAAYPTVIGRRMLWIGLW